MWRYLPSCPQSRRSRIFPRVVGIVGRDQAAFPAGAEIFGGVETEASQVSQTARAPSFVLGSVRLRRVLDHRNAPSPRDLDNRIHVRGLSV